MDPTASNDPPPAGPPVSAGHRSPWAPPPDQVPTTPPSVGPVPPSDGATSPESDPLPTESAWEAAATTAWSNPSGVAGGGSSAPSSEPLQGVRGQRYGGPRFGGRGILAVFGLLGILLTLGIVAFLSIQVLGGVGGVDDGGGTDVSSALQQLAPTSAPTTAVAGAPTTAGSAQVAPGGSVDAALVARCALDRQTVMTAAEAYQAMNGSYPPDVATLQAAGLVKSDQPIEVELHVEGATISVVGTGRCAGR